MGEAVAYELRAVEKSLRVWRDLQWRTTEIQHKLKEL